MNKNKFVSTFMMDDMTHYKDGIARDINFPNKVEKLIWEKGPVKIDLKKLYEVALIAKARCNSKMTTAERDELYADLFRSAMSVLTESQQKMIQQFRGQTYNYRWDHCDKLSRSREEIILDYATGIAAFIENLI